MSSQGSENSQLSVFQQQCNIQDHKDKIKPGDILVILSNSILYHLCRYHKQDSDLFSTLCRDLPRDKIKIIVPHSFYAAYYLNKNQSIDAALLEKRKSFLDFLDKSEVIKSEQIFYSDIGFDITKKSENIDDHDSLFINQIHPIAIKFPNNEIVVLVDYHKFFRKYREVRYAKVFREVHHFWTWAKIKLNILDVNAIQERYNETFLMSMLTWSRISDTLPVTNDLLKYDNLDLDVLNNNGKTAVYLLKEKLNNKCDLSFDFSSIIQGMKDYHHDNFKIDDYKNYLDYWQKEDKPFQELLKNLKNNLDIKDENGAKVLQNLKNSKSDFERYLEVIKNKDDSQFQAEKDKLKNVINKGAENDSYPWKTRGNQVVNIAEESAENIQELITMVDMLIRLVEKQHFPRSYKLSQLMHKCYTDMRFGFDKGSSRGI